MVLDATRPEYFESSLINLSTRLNKDKQKLVILLNKADLAPSQSAINTDASISGKATDENSKIDENNKIGDTENQMSIDETVSQMSIDKTQNQMSDDSAITDRSVKELIEQIKMICSNSSETAKERLLSPISILPISAKQKLGITSLKELLINMQKDNSKVDSNATLVTNARHYQALMDAQIALYRVEDGLAAGTPTDLVAQDIREALYHLGSIVGEINTEEILGNIFSRFCIGK